MTLILPSECTNGAIDEEIIMFVYYSQNGCILLAKSQLHDASKKLCIVKIQVECVVSC